jgi:hypothetical protein
VRKIHTLASTHMHEDAMFFYNHCTFLLKFWMEHSLEYVVEVWMVWDRNRPSIGKIETVYKVGG